MGKINVYLPSELEEAVREAGVPVSNICQAALREAIEADCDHPVVLRQNTGRYRCEACRRTVEVRKKR